MAASLDVLYQLAAASSVNELLPILFGRFNKLVRISRQKRSLAMLHKDGLGAAVVAALAGLNRISAQGQTAQDAFHSNLLQAVAACTSLLADFAHICKSGVSAELITQQASSLGEY